MQCRNITVLSEAEQMMVFLRQQQRNTEKNMDLPGMAEAEASTF